MNRQEALRTLGLDEDATEEDIAIAYKESVQIMHPDRFAGKPKLQKRATEQFKNLQEAYAYLKEHGGKGGAKSSGSSRRAGASREDELEARLAGIQAARTQLVAQRDALFDSRRNGLGMLVVGGLVALFMRRIVWLAGIAGTAAVWGLIEVVSTTQNINSLSDRLDELTKEKKKILQEIEELG